MSTIGASVLQHVTAVPKPRQASHNAIILRDWIHDSLYNPQKGYFMKKASIIPQRRSRNDLISLFRSFKNRSAYMAWLKDWYREQEDGNAWRTPSELFGALYAEPIAKYILQLYPRFNGRPLRIIEFGPGRGATCSHLMDFFKTKMPLVYANMSYECVEISSAFAESLQATVARNHPLRVRITNTSAYEYKGFGTDDPCIVIGLELLDNLTHDRVVIRNDGSKSETYVKPQQTRKGNILEFSERPLQDPLISTVLDITQSIKPHYKEVYVPTGSYKLLEHLATVVPNAALLFSDFDYFPGQEPSVLGSSLTVKNEPAVHATIEGRTKLYRSMLRAPYGADIYFPTDFSDLEKVYTHLNPASKAISMRHSDFLRRYADALTLKACTSMDGYSPLLNDYENTSFFLSLPQALQQPQAEEADRPKKNFRRR